MDISVIIVGWKAKRFVELCLESLSSAPPKCSMEVILVDNASDDGTSEMVEFKFPWVKLIRSSENLGFAKGNNVAIRRSQGRYIALVNPDVVIMPGCLDALADFLDRETKAGAVGPRVMNPDGTVQCSCRRFPTLWNNFCSAAALASAFKRFRPLSGEQMFYFPHDRSRTVDVLVFCIAMIRREALETVGLLDEDLFMYGDDVDWCRRAWNTRWEVHFFPGAQAIHDCGSTTAPYPVRFAVAQQKSVLCYWSKHHAFLHVIGIRGIMLFHHALRYLFAVLAGLAFPQKQAQSRVRRSVSGACLRQIISGNSPAA